MRSLALLQTRLSPGIGTPHFLSTSPYLQAIVLGHTHEHTNAQAEP
jgi:hypothetical protein